MFDYKPSALQRWQFTDGELAFQPISYAEPVAPARSGGADAAIKRGFDVIVALLGLAVFALPMLIAMLIIRLDSPGPAVFRQRRIGLNGVAFDILKFRTMRAQDDHGVIRQARPMDPRVTRIGRWLRRTSFDELPQLVNVLLGEMSIVGPRPHAPGTCAAGRPFETVTSRYAERHSVKPGMTGLAQVRGWRGETDTEAKFFGRLDSDLEYIETRSLLLDIGIVWRTVFTVLRPRNVW